MFNRFLFYVVILCSDLVITASRGGHIYHQGNKGKSHSVLLPLTSGGNVNQINDGLVSGETQSIANDLWPTK